MALPKFLRGTAKFGTALLPLLALKIVTPPKFRVSVFVDRCTSTYDSHLGDVCRPIHNLHIHCYSVRDAFMTGQLGYTLSGWVYTQRIFMFTFAPKLIAFKYIKIVSTRC